MNSSHSSTKIWNRLIGYLLLNGRAKWGEKRETVKIRCWTVTFLWHRQKKNYTSGVGSEHNYNKSKI